MKQAPSAIPEESRSGDARRLTILYHHRTRSADGQSVHIDGLVGALRAAGHTVHVVGPRRIAATEAPLTGRILPRFLHEIFEIAYNLIEFWELSRAAVRHRPDGLYERGNVFLFSGAWAARWFRLPFIVEVNAPVAVERKTFGGMSLPRLAAWSERYLWRAADWVLPVSAVLGRVLESAGVRRSRIRVTPNGINPEILRASDPDLMKQSLGLDGGLVLGFAGFVREWHGLEKIVDLLRSEPALSSARLLIAGDGPARDAIVSRARENNVHDRVLITGVVPHSRVAGLVSAMDIALQPEVTAYASPLKLFEYMALGRAIVAPDSENIREILDDGVDGLLFRANDSDSLTGILCKLAANPDLRQRLGAAAAAKISRRKLTWSHNADKVVAIIREQSRTGSTHVASTRISAK